jgi:hypothetical protein
MKHPILAILLAVAFAGCTKQPSVEFGLLDHDTVTPATDIKYEIGTSYGFRVHFPKDIGTVLLKQQFILPGAAQWTSSGTANVEVVKSDVSPDGSTLVSETKVDTSINPEVTNRFRIIEGDPEGLHTINLWLNGVPLKTITFTITK